MTPTGPKKKHRSLKRDVRLFVAGLIESALMQDGFSEGMGALGWNFEDPDIASRMNAEMQRIKRSLQSGR